jgi:pimeloyl-ACP methyl ester carboxylesterase
MTPWLRGAGIGALISALFLGEPASAQSSAPANRPHAKTVVLVHGFFADGSSWSEVIPLLQAAGIDVVAVQNPLSSLDADVEATRRVVDQQAGEVVLVGHSFGGMSITQAGIDPKVASLVYVCAFAPSPGDSINTLQAGLPPPPWLADLVFDDAGDYKLTQAGVLQYFAPDVPVRQAKVISAVQGAFFIGTLDQAVTDAAWLTKPSSYVQCADDQIIDPGLELRMASKINAKLVSIHSSHVAMISHPEIVARTIIEAALKR